MLLVGACPISCCQSADVCYSDGAQNRREPCRQRHAKAGWCTHRGLVALAHHYVTACPESHPTTIRHWTDTLFTIRTENGATLASPAIQVSQCHASAVCAFALFLFPPSPPIDHFSLHASDALLSFAPMSYQATKHHTNQYYSVQVTNLFYL